jgi:hypothetical protein
MQEQKFILKFEGISTAEANMYAAELQPLLQKAAKEDANIKRAQAANNTQDFGASLVIAILGTPAVVKLIEEIGKYLQKRRSGKITLKTDKGEIIAENLGSNDVADLTEKWMNQLEK